MRHALRFALLIASLLAWRPALAAEKTLVFLGDSLTAGFGLNEDQAYPALFARELASKRPDWKVVNAGISGDTSAGGLKRLDWVLRSKPTAVFVCLGANDGLRGLSLESSTKNLEAILKKARAAGAAVYLGGMELPTNYGATYRLEFHRMYEGLARRLKVELLPFILAGVGGVASLNQADGIHPTAEGQQKVAATVSAFLLPRLDKLEASAGKAAAPKKVIRKRSDMEAR